MLATIFVTADAQATVDTISAHVTGLRDDTGQVGCLLFASANGFARDPKRAVARRLVPISGKAALCVFEPVRPGTYAVIAMHDENSNGKLDMNVLGMPTEGFGTTGAGRGRFGPPKFEDAAFQYPGGAMTVSITIRY
jgi:uncharacterized protein (DUF2141 family)